MKTIKILSIVFIAALICNAADSVKVYAKQTDSLLTTSGIIGGLKAVSPANIKTVWIAGNGNKSDTVPVNCHNIIGPVPLTNGPGRPMYSGFALYSYPLQGTTPVGEIRYQVTPSASLSDTLTGHWVIVDTLDTDGETDYHVIDSTNIGNYAWFDLHNYDATATTFKARVIFKANETYMNDVKK